MGKNEGLSNALKKILFAVNIFVILAPYVKILSINGVAIEGSSNIIKNICSLLSIGLFGYYLFNFHKEIKNDFNRIFVSKIKIFLIDNGASKVDNLSAYFKSREIKETQDLYYIKDIIVLKTTNLTSNGNYCPPGLCLKMGKKKYYTILSTRIIASIFDINFIYNSLLITTSVFVFFSYLFKIFFL